MSLLQRIALSFLFCAAACAQTPGPSYRLRTNLGDIDVVLTPLAAPQTVANFINYVNTGAYTNTVFHRSVSKFIIQAGGFALKDHQLASIPQNAAVKNEFNVTNSRGTIAMAKLDGQPDSATNQFFLNLANNGSNLDNQNGGFTVFGRVQLVTSLAVMDQIGLLPVYNLGSPFDSIPLYQYPVGSAIQDSNYVTISSIFEIPYIIARGMTSAASYAVSSDTGIAPGEVLTIFGTHLGPADLASLTLDSNGVVTTSLAGTRVLFDGTPAPLIYTSAGQIGLVAPQNIAGKTSVRVAVEYEGLTTNTITYQVAPANPGVFTLDTSGSGDGAIIRPNGDIINAANPGVPGEILVLYGEGYGAASVAVPDGTIVSTVLPIPNTPVKLLIDGQPVETLYAGGAPALISGLLQVNFRVPNFAPGAHAIQIQVGDRKSSSAVLLRTR